MAATSKRPGQNEIRKLMKEQRTKRIESPLAKYNSAGQLFCVVCNQQVKNELVWPAHLNGKAHKEKVIELKQKSVGPKPLPPPPARAAAKEQFKRPFEVNSNDNAAKRVKVDTSSLSKIRAQGPAQGPAKGQPVLSSKAKKMALRKFADEMEGQAPAEESPESDSDDDDDDDDDVPNIQIGSDIPKDALPPDFFDNVPTSSSKAAAVDADAPAASSSSSSKLPEGFFDDPVVDARIRKAEPKKEKMQAEWDLFQKVIREATNVSEEQIAEDEQERMGEKIIEEIDEQIYLWSKVEELHKKKEEVVQSVTTGGAASTSQPTDVPNKEADEEADEDSSSSDVDQAEFEKYLDWRSKKWRS